MYTDKAGNGPFPTPIDVHELSQLATEPNYEVVLYKNGLMIDINAKGRLVMDSGLSPNFHIDYYSENSGPRIELEIMEGDIIGIRHIRDLEFQNRVVDI
jgi:hypothetical protein